ncbi:MAG: hypothetical protein R3E79_47350 [Caldilineaceae bacterium]
MGRERRTTPPPGAPAAPAPVERHRRRRRQPRKDCRPLQALPKPKDGQYWGYASGIVVTKVDDWGEVVLAELTQTFDHADELLFPTDGANRTEPGAQTQESGAWDAAYDTFYVHEYFTLAGGFAACRGSHAHRPEEDFLARRPAALWRKGWPCHSKCGAEKSNCLVPHELGRCACPLLFPQQPVRSAPSITPTGGERAKGRAVSPLCPPASARTHATNSAAPVKRTSASMTSAAPA